MRINRLSGLWLGMIAAFVVLAVLAAVRAADWSYGADTGTFVQIVLDAFGVLVLDLRVDEDLAVSDDRRAVAVAGRGLPQKLRRILPDGDRLRGRVVALRPEPLGPISPKTSPGDTASDMPFTATNPPNALVRPCTSRRAAMRSAFLLRPRHDLAP